MWRQTFRYYWKSCVVDGIRNSSYVLRRDPQHLRYVGCEITNHCNLKCAHCFFAVRLGDRRDKGYMDEGIFRKIIDQLKPLGAGIMANGAGESLLHPRFLDLLEYTVAKGVPVFFNTNGTLFDRTFSDNLLAFYKGSVFFSIDGVDRESHNRLRKGSDYDRVVEHIEYFLEQRKRRGKTQDVKIGVGNVNNVGREEIRRPFLETWLNRVDVVNFAMMYGNNSEVISERFEGYQVPKRKICRIPWQILEISWKGDVSICPKIFAWAEGEGPDVLGNVSKDLLTDIWHGEKAWAFRRRLAAGEIAGTQCENCDKWQCFDIKKPVILDGVSIDRNGIFMSYQRRNGN
jgi:MoaA/NifB/PqqE/SkfB family radical SAM enzyme